MPHRIGRNEPIDAALFRLLLEDVEKARDGLGGTGPAEVRVHRARQRLKRARSLLIVLKPALGVSTGRVKRALSEAARLLARARDAAAAAASARGLRAVADGEVVFDRVALALDRQASEAHSRPESIEEAVARLTVARDEIALLGAAFSGETLFAEAIERVYRDGRKAMGRARSSLSTPDLHRWRKDVKDLWHLLRLGRKRLPKNAALSAKRLEQLADLLGRDHDHAILAEKLALSPDADHGLLRQLSVIARERRRLEADAFRVGKAAYQEKPSRFARRMAVR